ncbi:MAG: hypothetical protein ACLFPQ_06520 [Candidatus Woesearchaeota archaeon]
MPKDIDPKVFSELKEAVALVQGYFKEKESEQMTKEILDCQKEDFYKKDYSCFF